MSLKTRVILSLTLICCAGPALADLTVIVREGVSDAIPVAIVPFGWAGDSSAPLDIAAVVDADLKRSGRFAPMDRADMIEKPVSGADVDFADWRLLGAEVVAIGSLGLSPDGRFAVDFQLFDVVRGEQLLAYTIPARPDALRAAAHRVSDLVYEALTGERGAFSTRIAYISAKDGEYELIVADADGANQQVIVRSNEPLMSPAWSPDSSRLAYVAFENVGTAIYVQELATGQRRRVSARPGVNGAPAWSPDGQRLALALSNSWGNVDIHVIDLDTAKLQRLTEHSGIDTEPAWSVDGETLFFTSDRARTPQIYQIPLAGGTPERVTYEGNYNARPRLSPTQQKIAVVHNDRGSYRIALVDLGSGATQVLTRGRLDESPSFAPNGSMIIYATEDNGLGVLAAVSTDGRIHQQLVSRQGDVREPVWSPFAVQ
ncbi:MAG: Tol-Pal system beta propeller repeat protein TolB [Gammaproteobacteria bacterium]|nr:Tol-Pal system beta propeller repeat protein TolB [Gammaproteobacteria bacterium]